MDLFPYFEWCEQSLIGDTIRSSQWMFPSIEAVHLMGLAAIGGAVLVVNLRMLGLGLRRQPIAQVMREAQPYLVGSLVVMLLTGFLLFMSEAVKCYYNVAFWVKMSSLALAMLFTFTIHRKVAMADESGINPFWMKFVALVSVALWSGVGMGGRWIGFE
jgi:hypothetical protein